jgi:hypothetical protein
MATILNPLRLEVLKRLTVVLESMDTADGYIVDEGFAGDMAGRVFRGRTVFGEKDPLPMLSLLEVPIPLDQLPAPTDSGFSSGGWELMLQGFLRDDRENPTDPGHVLLADVKQMLARESRKASYSGPDTEGILGLGRQVLKMNIGPGIVRPPDELSAKAYFWLTVTLDLAEDLTEPYRV